MSFALSVVTVKGLLFIILLVLISYSDLRTRCIPNWMSLALGCVGLMDMSPLPALIGLFTTSLPYLIAAVCSQGKIGGGDIKLMAACGFVLGPLGGILQSVFGLTLVLCIAAGIGCKHGFQTAKQTALPLAPFLSAGGVFAFIALHF